MIPGKFLQARRLFHRIQHREQSLRAIEATYDYVDEEGRLLFQVVRFPGKYFRQRRPDGAGDWVWRLGDVRRVLYHLDELTRADGARPVYVVEGEKDVDRLRQHSLVATCNPGGAHGWRFVSACARQALVGRDVIVIADRDENGIGQRLAREIEASLGGVARSIRVVVPPPPFKDASDLFDARPGVDTTSTLEELVDLDAYERAGRGQ